MKIAKKIAVGSLACATLAASAVSLAGCGGSTWALKTDNAEISSGVYNYALYAGYYNALYSVEDYTQPVLDQEIDGQSSEEWIRNYAMEYFIKPFLVVDETFNEMGLTLDDVTRYNAKQYAISDWESYQKTFEPYGITRDDYQYVGYDYNAKFTAIFEALYGKGGEQEVSQEELDAYFAEHYASVDYIVAETVLDDGTTMTDEEIDALVTQFQDFAKQINAGDMTMNDAANEYSGIETTEGETSEDAAEESTEEETAEDNGLYTYIGSLENDTATSSFPADFITAIQKAKAGTAYALDLSDEGYVILFTRADDETAQATFFDETTEAYEQNIFQILVDMKQEDYIAYMDELVTNYDASKIVYNEDVTTNLDLKALFEPTEEEEESSAAADDTETTDSETADETTDETASADTETAE